MLKNILKLNGAQKLGKAEQVDINGGFRPNIRPTRLDCVGEPNGTLCYHNGHPECPGECSGGECIPY